jgi:HAD superfamily hydrolase (TIGR01509 family)
MNRAKRMSHTFKLCAVIFDMDGLMFDTERVSRDAWRKAMAEWRYEVSDALYLMVIGRTIEDAKAIFCQELGDNLPIDEIYQRKQYYMDEIISHSGVPVKPGLLELLDNLTQQSLLKAVASSTDRKTVMQKLELANLTDRFNVIVCGDEVQRGKPAPDIFLLASKKLNVAPNLCAVLEDSDSGVKAAYAAGMLPIMIPDLKPPSEEIAKIAYSILPSLHEVLFLLQKYITS